jgi:DNA-binding transcriptional regulator YdaS (Cro superfamily)
MGIIQDKTFRWYWEAMQPEQKKRLAATVGSTYQVLHHVARGRRDFAPKRARAVQAALKGMGFSHVKLSHLRPDIWTKE